MIIEWDPIEKNQKCKLQSLNGVDTSNSIKNIEVRYMIDRKDYTCRKMDWHINKVVLCQEKVQIKYNQFSLFM